MNGNVLLMITSLFYLALIAVLYFSKKGINNFETRIYKLILVIGIIGVILDLIGVYVSINVPDTHIIRWIVVKAYYTYLLFMCYLLSVYMFIPGSANSLNSKQKKDLVTYTFVFIIFEIIHLLLPIYYYKNGNIIYAYGPDNTFLYIAVGFTVLVWIIYLLRDIKKIQQKKNLPIVALIILLLPIVVIQMLRPYLLLVSGLLSFIIVIMFHTIENPDKKMLEEFRIAKDRAEKANEEKEIFLYDITQDIRLPLHDIKTASDWITKNVKEIDNDDVTDGMDYIGTKANAVLERVNKVLDISNMELVNIKVYDTKYDVGTIIAHLKKTYPVNPKEDVELRFYTDSNIPKYLYGDALRIRQLVQILIDNAIKFTDEGTIDVKINTIIRRGLCRLIVSVEDTGCGIKPSEIDEIFNKENRLYNSLDKIDDSKKNLAIAKSIAHLLGGILLLDSELGRGTRLTLVLDQKIYDEKSKELNKLEEDSKKYIGKKKVMLIIEDKEYMEKVSKKLAKQDIYLEKIDMGAKGLEKIRLNHKYDLIMIDESLHHLSSLEILNKLKKITNFQTPVCLLTDNTENDAFIKEGFKYLLDKKVSKKDIEDIISKI